MNDDISPDIAALLADTDSLPSTNFPSLDNIPEVKIEPEKSISKSTTNSQASVDLTQKTFKPVEKYYMDTPSPVFADNTYYKTALSGENEAAQRLHAMLTKYLTCKDVKDKYYKPAGMSVQAKNPPPQTKNRRESPTDFMVSPAS